MVVKGKARLTEVETRRAHCSACAGARQAKTARGRAQAASALHQQVDGEAVQPVDGTDEQQQQKNVLGDGAVVLPGGHADVLAADAALLHHVLLRAHGVGGVDGGAAARGAAARLFLLPRGVLRRKRPDVAALVIAQAVKVGTGGSHGRKSESGDKPIDEPRQQQQNEERQMESKALGQMLADDAP